MLTPDQVRSFSDDGYVAIPDLLTPREVAALQGETRRLQAAGPMRNVATAGDGKTPSTTAKNLQLCPIGGHSPLIRSLRFHEPVVRAVAALIGDPVAFVLDQIFLKPARSGVGTRWHQDDAYFAQAAPRHGTGLWIAIHEATSANGTMRVVPGSHRRTAGHERDPGSDHHLFAPQVRDDDGVAIELPAGGALFFSFGMLHCTRGNLTDRDRAALALHFINGEHATDAFLARGEVTWLTGDRASGGEREFGERIAGTWSGEVSRVLATSGSVDHRPSHRLRS